MQLEIHDLQLELEKRMTAESEYIAKVKELEHFRNTSDTNVTTEKENDTTATGPVGGLSNGVVLLKPKGEGKSDSKFSVNECIDLLVNM